MSNIFDNKLNKTKCQKFTPDDMVKKMLDLAGYTKNLVGKTILENSFGSGNILVEIVKRYIEDCIQTGLCPGTIATNLTRDIFGVELDQELFNSCVKRLNKIAGEYGILDVTWSLYNGNALSGSGNILVEIVKRYIEDCIQTGLCPGTIATNLTRDIFGVELDQELFNSCVKRLNKIAGEYGILDVTWSLYNGNALTHTFDREFDFIIGNPPYIAYKDLDNDSKDYLKKNFISCKQGKFDYCYAFIECGIKLLSPAGKLVQLVPSSRGHTRSHPEHVG